MRGDTLYFPSSFTSWKGEALDYKTPLLRSQRAVNVAATKLLHQMGRTEVSEVHANVGWEQECVNCRPRHYACAMQHR